MPIKKVTDETFKKEVLENSKPVKNSKHPGVVFSPLVINGASRSGPCKQLIPMR